MFLFIVISVQVVPYNPESLYNSDPSESCTPASPCYACLLMPCHAMNHEAGSANYHPSRYDNVQPKTRSHKARAMPAPAQILGGVFYKLGDVLCNIAYCKVFTIS